MRVGRYQQRQRNGKTGEAKVHVSDRMLNAFR